MSISFKNVVKRLSIFGQAYFLTSLLLCFEPPASKNLDGSFKGTLKNPETALAFPGVPAPLPSRRAWWEFGGLGSVHTHGSSGWNSYFPITSQVLLGCNLWSLGPWNSFIQVQTLTSMQSDGSSFWDRNLKFLPNFSGALGIKYKEGLGLRLNFGGFLDGSKLLASSGSYPIFRAGGIVELGKESIWASLYSGFALKRKEKTRLTDFMGLTIQAILAHRVGFGGSLFRNNNEEVLLLTSSAGSGDNPLSTTKGFTRPVGGECFFRAALLQRWDLKLSYGVEKLFQYQESFSKEAFKTSYLCIALVVHSKALPGRALSIPPLLKPAWLASVSADESEVIPQPVTPPDLPPVRQEIVSESRPVGGYLALLDLGVSEQAKAQAVAEGVEAYQLALLAPVSDRPLKPFKGTEESVAQVSPRLQEIQISLTNGKESYFRTEPLASEVPQAPAWVLAPCIIKRKTYTQASAKPPEISLIPLFPGNEVPLILEQQWQLSFEREASQGEDALFVDVPEGCFGKAYFSYKNSSEWPTAPLNLAVVPSEPLEEDGYQAYTTLEWKIAADFTQKRFAVYACSEEPTVQSWVLSNPFQLRYDAKEADALSFACAPWPFISSQKTLGLHTDALCFELSREDKARCLDDQARSVTGYILGLNREVYPEVLPFLGTSESVEEEQGFLKVAFDLTNQEGAYFWAVPSKPPKLDPALLFVSAPHFLMMKELGDSEGTTNIYQLCDYFPGNETTIIKEKALTLSWDEGASQRHCILPSKSDDTISGKAFFTYQLAPGKVWPELPISLSILPDREQGGKSAEYAKLFLNLSYRFVEIDTSKKSFVVYLCHPEGAADLTKSYSIYVDGEGTPLVTFKFSDPWVVQRGIKFSLVTPARKPSVQLMGYDMVYRAEPAHEGTAFAAGSKLTYTYLEQFEALKSNEDLYTQFNKFGSEYLVISSGLLELITTTEEPQTEINELVEGLYSTEIKGADGDKNLYRGIIPFFSGLKAMGYLYTGGPQPSVEDPTRPSLFTRFESTELSDPATYIATILQNADFYDTMLQNIKGSGGRPIKREELREVYEAYLESGQRIKDQPPFTEVPRMQKTHVFVFTKNSGESRYVLYNMNAPSENQDQAYTLLVQEEGVLVYLAVDFGRTITYTGEQ